MMDQRCTTQPRRMTFRPVSPERSAPQVSVRCHEIVISGTNHLLQLRGHPVRFPLDVMLAFSANPEDYTNRGSIITPLRDRIASQIITHYPKDLATSRTITEQEAWTERDDAEVHIPAFLRDVIEQVAFQARRTSRHSRARRRGAWWTDWT